VTDCRDEPNETFLVASFAFTEWGYNALVLTCEEALDEGLWGPGDSSPTFERHCGDVLIIPDKMSVWHGGEADALELIGEHGGCHPDEMLVPFASVRGNRLQ
jgi:hypothetical protein